ncbi:MAG: DUF4174 domain-containing protein [Cyclobacteriaceae bacterium]
MKGFIIISLAMAGFSALLDPITLDDLKWEKRILLIFQSEHEPPFQLTLDDGLKQEITDRDLIYFVFGDSIFSNSNYTFEGAYAEKIKKLYRQGAKSSCYVLLGKDGGSKLRKEGENLDWEELFATIDAMPMRRQEMKNNLE